MEFVFFLLYSIACPFFVFFFIAFPSFICTYIYTDLNRVVFVRPGKRKTLYSFVTVTIFLSFSCIQISSSHNDDDEERCEREKKNNLIVITVISYCIATHPLLLLCYPSNILQNISIIFANNNYTMIPGKLHLINVAHIYIYWSIGDTI